MRRGVCGQRRVRSGYELWRGTGGTLFSKEWVEAEGMAYVDDADSPTTETEGSEAETDEEEAEGEETEEEEEKEEMD